MLAVVDELAGLAIVERRRAAAEPAARLEHEHARAPGGQPDGRAQPGEPGADDDGVVVVSSLATAIASGRSAPAAAAAPGSAAENTS